MKTKLVKIFSAILALVCALSIFGAVGNVRDVLNAKDYWEGVRAEAIENFDKMDDGIDQLAANKQTYLEGVDTYEAGYAEYQAGLITLEEGRKQVAEGEATLAAGQAEFDAGAKELAAGHEEYDKGLIELEEGKGRVRTGEIEYYAGVDKLEKGKAEYDAGMQTYNDNATLLAGAEAQLEAKRPDYEAGKEKIASVEPLMPVLNLANTILGNAEKNYNKAVENGDWLGQAFNKLGADLAKTEIPGVGSTVSGAVQQYNDGVEQIALFEENEALLNEKKEQLAEGKEKLDAAADEIAAGEAQLAEGERSLAFGYGQLYEGEIKLAEAKILLAENDEKLAAAKEQLEQGKKDLEAGKLEVAEGEKKIAEAEVQLADGKAQLKVFEDGEDELAAGLDQAIGTDTYYDKDGNALVTSIKDRLGRDFYYWALENGKTVVKNDHKFLDLSKAAEVSAAGRGFLADNGKAVTKEMTGRIICAAAAIIAAVVCLAAAVLAFLGNLKPSTLLGIIGSAVSVVGVVYALAASSDLPYSKVAGAVNGQSMAVVLGVLAAAAVAHCAVSLAAKKAEEADIVS